MPGEPDPPPPVDPINAGYLASVGERIGEPADLRAPEAPSPDWQAALGDGHEPGAASSRANPTPTPPASPALPEGATPIRGIAARIVANMSASLAIPTATSYREIPVATLEARRAQLNEALAASGRKVSLTHLVAYAIVQAAAARPAMLAHFVEAEGSPYRIESRTVNLGLAVDVEGRDGSRSLIVPVVRNAQELDFGAFVAAADDLVGRARSSRLKPDELAGATITLTNPGTVGTSASVPRLMPGQGTIVATGTIRRWTAVPLMTISSTYDHRIIQGAESGLFLRAIQELLEGADDFYGYAARCFGLTLPEAVPEAPRGEPAAALPSPPAPASVDSGQLAEVAAGMALIDAYRAFGYRAARLDPLGAPPPGDPALDPGFWGLTADALAGIPTDVLGLGIGGATLDAALPQLATIYCGTTGFEVEHVSNHEERAWLRETIETGRYRLQLSDEDRRRLLDRLTAVEALEQFLGRAFLGQKRFSIEGLDALVPMLERIVTTAGVDAIRTVEIGMAHRGRLNVLAHVVGVPTPEILEEFEAPTPDGDDGAIEGATSDVKYHLGAEGDVTTPGGQVRVIIPSNPSHLESVDPVVEGRTRAEQTDRSGDRATRDDARALAVLVHGDGAFAAQGVVAETFNLARLAGYSTGGTIHLLGDNQLAFTVPPAEGRSTDFASDLAKGFDVPIVHVNADDPEACLDAVALAMAYRQR
ncbi:MAG TPA: 2-oxo acid dehydrogenase subunit E2, partial [Candidatus Limnocylindrales bacterium]|nr:2-oxo acid dehydrogenase subunit E2 [Candidatus Limnocylindrales bacterium]